MILFLVSIILVLLFVFLVYNLLRALTPLQKGLALFLVICAHLVLALEISSLFGALNRPLIILLVQAGLDAAAFGLNRMLHIGTPKITFTSLKEGIKETLADRKSVV